MLTKFNIFIAAFSAVLGFGVGFLRDHSLTGGLSTLFLTVLLAVLEITFSFDNAVVNATILRQMTPKWRHRFMTWGIALAVFGMRLVFPIAVVSCVGGIWPWQAVSMALFDAPNYVRLMTSAQLPLAGFGGTFLTMAAFNYFIDADKDAHWFKSVEGFLARLARAPYVTILMGLALTFGMSYLPATLADQAALFKSGIFGVGAFLAVQCIGGILQMPAQGRVSLERASAALFVYLEVLDASCSFDSVIGAFALTNNLLIIAAGLGVGAMVVRGLTSALVEKNSLENFAYLEHGAYYAIGALGLLMLVNTAIPIPGIVIGLTGAAVIAASIVASSWRPGLLRAGWSNSMTAVGSVLLSLSLVNGVWGYVKSTFSRAPRAAVVTEATPAQMASPRFIRTASKSQNVAAASEPTINAPIQNQKSESVAASGSSNAQNQTQVSVTAQNIKASLKELRKRTSAAATWLELSCDEQAFNLVKSARQLLRSFAKHEGAERALAAQAKYFPKFSERYSNLPVEGLNLLYKANEEDLNGEAIDHPALLALVETLSGPQWGTLIEANKSVESCDAKLTAQML